MKPPFFSIIIPTFNREHFLQKAIDSIICQTFKDWELIIVDDGSTDNTKQTVLNFSKSDPRIIYVHQKNSERSAARNKGINISNGEFICFLDSDDYYLENRLMLLFDFVKSNKEHVIYYTGITTEKNQQLLVSPPPPLSIINPFDFLLNATLHCQQVCIHHTVLKKHQFNPIFSIGEDLELWLRIIDEYPFKFIENQNTVVIVEHDERSVNEIYSNSGLKYIDTLNFAFKPPHPGAKASKKEKNKRLSNTYFGIAKHYMYNSNKGLSFTYLIKSIIQLPSHQQTKHKLFLLGSIIGIFKKHQYNKG